MKTKIYSIATALLAIGLVGCDDNWDPKLDSEGQLQLSSMGVDVTTAEKLVSRADDSVDVSGFVIEITQADKVVESWTYAAMPEVVTLPVGDYTAKVYSHQVKKQDWDAPYYLGSKDFTIKKNAITEIGTISCKFASVKVTVKYSDELREQLGADCKVTVVANDDGRLEYAVDETRSGYFEALSGSNTLVATFEGTLKGATKPVVIQRTFNDVEAGNHYCITFKTKNTDPIIYEGTVDPSGIGVDTSITDVNTGAQVGITEEDIIDRPGTKPGSEEFPDEPDQPGTDNITFKTSLSLTSPNSVNVDEAVVLIHSNNGFAHLNVTIDSSNDAFVASASELMPLEFDLATIAETNPTDAANLASVGLPVGPYEGTDITFDITDLAPLMGAFSGTHTFTLEVVDKNGEKNSIKLVFFAE